MTRVGIDIGGTFTDGVAVDSDGAMRVTKTQTTPADPAEGFLRALRALGAADPAYLAHGSTVAANAIVQGRLARVGLLATAGFGDVLAIGTQQRSALYDLSVPRPDPLVPPGLRLEARGRIGADGAEMAPLADRDVERAAATLRSAGVEAVAVAFLFSFLNPDHERRAARILAERLPGVPVALSCEVAPELREYPRTATTVITAALLPAVGGYVRGLAERLAAAGVGAPVHVMQSNGGVATAAQAAARPAGLISSGPAAGVTAAARLATAAGADDVLTFDMGGTTADVAVATGGAPLARYRGEVAGHPVSLPQIDVLSVGAGGGSVAAVDGFGALAVGPRSAGAAPGPAAYGLGGEEATVTDAHVVLGTLGGRPLGGEIELDPAAARRAVGAAVARPLRLSVAEAARAILRVADATMLRAMRVISVARGHDPRRFGLVAFGGAGPMHACAIADDLGIRRVLLPPHPGVAAALGLLVSDVRHDLRVGWPCETERVRVADLRRRLAALEREGRALLAAAGHARSGRVRAFADMRYRGQAYELTVPLAGASRDAVARAERAFHAAHRRTYGHDRPVAGTEIVTLRVQAVGPVAAPRLQGPPWKRVRGPAVVAREDTTVVVPARWSLRPAAAGAALLERR